MTSVLLSLALLAPPAQAARNTCGDGNARAGEACDGADLAGQTCASLGYDGGSLACAGDCTLDTSACTTTTAEVCGDGVVGGYEECDGADDGACPGACSDHCACPATGAGELEVHVIDVGQGDGILVVSPDGFTLLVDAGTQTNADVVAAYLDAVGIPGLDYVLVSHLHADHMGGMAGVLGTWPEVVAAFDNGGSATTGVYDAYVAAAGTRRQTLDVGQTIDLGPSMRAEVLHGQTGASNENDNSLVVKLTYGGDTVLLGGDCEAACEGAFDPGPTEIYKAHHHGSSTSSTADFLALMSPEVAVISVGTGNAYGHPGADTLQRLADAGATVYRTDLDGDIALSLSGSGYTINGQASCTEGEARACGVTDIGACSYGTQTCTAGAWGTCTGAVDPVVEACANGLDDDCDGLVDAADGDCAATSTALQLTQVAYDTPGTDAIEEFVDLYNPTGAAVSLDGWSLADGAGTWAFPAGTSIAAGAFLTVARDAAGLEAWTGVVPDVDGLTLSLNNGGDVLVLSDDLGAEVDRVAWESFEAGWTLTAGEGDSIVRAAPDVDTDSAADWGVRSPADPDGGSLGGGDTGGGDTGGAATCGDGTCDPGEDCTSCPADCDGVTGGKPANRYCCGNGACESVGEDAGTCPLDCAP